MRLVDPMLGIIVSGNPISYFNGNRWNFTWQNGRQLTSASTTVGNTDKGAPKQGMRLIKEGVRSLNTAQGAASVIGSVVGGTASVIKGSIKELLAT